MVRDLVALGVLVFAFATLVTVHLAIALGLFQRGLRAKALVGLLVAPLAPYLAWREKLRTRAVLWVVCAVTYAAARWVASSS